MPVTITRGKSEAENRYEYDFNELTTAMGWAQLDSRQDASYYGNWLNPVRREIFTYAEGDTTLTRCDTDAELLAELDEMNKWKAGSGYPVYCNDRHIAIDPGLGDDLERACVAAGLRAYLYDGAEVSNGQ